MKWITADLVGKDRNDQKSFRKMRVRRNNPRVEDACQKMRVRRDDSGHPWSVSEIVLCLCRISNLQNLLF